MIKKAILRSRYTLLLTVILAYIIAIVLEGMLTGREAAYFNLENSFFEFNVNDQQSFEDFIERNAQ